MGMGDAVWGWVMPPWGWVMPPWACPSCPAMAAAALVNPYQFLLTVLKNQEHRTLPLQKCSIPSAASFYQRRGDAGVFILFH